MTSFVSPYANLLAFFLAILESRSLLLGLSGRAPEAFLFNGGKDSSSSSKKENSQLIHCCSLNEQLITASNYR